MSSSPKSKRTPPSNRFEDYVLKYEVGPGTGLYLISNTAMFYSGLASSTGLGHAIQGYSTIDLGFTFNFNNNSYSKLLVSISGMCILVDPDNLLTAIDDTVNDIRNNTTIKDSFGNTKHIVLAPWFDDLRNSWRYSADKIGESYSAQSYLDLFNLTKDDLKYGKAVVPPGIDSSLGGVKFYSGPSDKGLCFVVRWKSFTYWSSNAFNIISFDLVLYENGQIEFRYSPRLLRESDWREQATIGIFANGELVSSPRYRDFAGVLRSDSRTQYVNGGSVYDGSYTDTDLYSSETAKYTVSLGTNLYWPGVGQFGAIFRFSPPAIRRRQNRSILNLRESSSFVGDGSSYFNDQNTIPFTSQVVEYPTMLPTSLRTSYNSSQAVYVNELYTSGSIQVTRTLSPGMFDSVLEDALLDGKRRSGG